MLWYEQGFRSFVGPQATPAWKRFCVEERTREYHGEFAMAAIDIVFDDRPSRYPRDEKAAAGMLTRTCIYEMSNPGATPDACLRTLVPIMQTQPSDAPRWAA
jgi:hypothetical protein